MFQKEDRERILTIRIKEQRNIRMVDLDKSLNCPPVALVTRTGFNFVKQFIHWILYSTQLY